MKENPRKGVSRATACCSVELSTVTKMLVGETSFVPCEAGLERGGGVLYSHSSLDAANSVFLLSKCSRWHCLFNQKLAPGPEAQWQEAGLPVLLGRISPLYCLSPTCGPQTLIKDSQRPGRAGKVRPWCPSFHSVPLSPVLKNSLKKVVPGIQRKGQGDGLFASSSF